MPPAAGGHRADQRRRRIVPAVLRYYQRFTPNPPTKGSTSSCSRRRRVGSLFKENASISGAEVGCQGEVGVACSMAAAGLTAALGGTPAQVENAAESAWSIISAGPATRSPRPVPVPASSANAVGAVKAIEASRPGAGRRRIAPRQLDQVIRDDAQDRPRHERTLQGTSLGGLAVNVVGVLTICERARFTARSRGSAA